VESPILFSILARLSAMLASEDELPGCETISYDETILSRFSPFTKFIDCSDSSHVLSLLHSVSNVADWSMSKHLVELAEYHFRWDENIK